MSEHRGMDHINSIIGEGTYFRGNLDLQGLLRIDGDFEGNIKTEGRVLVGRGGRARCFIEADSVVIGGVVKGDIRANSRVVLLSTCIVIGNIRSPKLVIEEGVLIHGHCTVTEDVDILAAAPSTEESAFTLDWNFQTTAASNTVPGL